MNTAEEIGKRIAEARDSKGLTQEDFAREVGVRSGIVSRWENGKNYPRIKTLERIATVLERDISYFTNGLAGPPPVEGGQDKLLEAMEQVKGDVAELREMLEQALDARLRKT